MGNTTQESRQVEMVNVNELKYGDVINLSERYGNATVVKIKDSVVTVFRPYVHTGDFEYTGGVLHYVGFEYVDLHFETQKVELVSRSEQEIR